MSKQKVTEDRYKSLKIILDNTPFNKRGISMLYDSLNISSSTASRIKRSANYQDYLKQREKYKLSRKPSVPQPPAPHQQTSLVGYEESVLIKLDSIEARLERIEKLLSTSTNGSSVIPLRKPSFRDRLMSNGR